MSWASISFLVVLLLAQNKMVTPDLPGLGDIQTYANFANDAIGILKGDLSVEALALGSTGPTLDKVLASIADLGDQLSHFMAKNDEKLDQVLDTIIETINIEGKLKPALRDLHICIERVDNLYRKFEYMSQNQSLFNQYTIKKFAHTITSNEQGDLPNTLNRLKSLIMPGRSSAYSDSIVTLLGNKIKSQKPTDQCNSGGSAQLKLNDFYDTVTLCEARGFLMTLFVYSVLTVYENSTFNFEMELAQKQFVKRSDDYLLTTVKEMEGLPRNIELCDARRYKLGKNYYNFPVFLSLSELPGRCVPTAPQLTDIKNNRVLTGVKWTMKKNMLQIQIKEGTLMPNGKIDPKSERWIPVPDYDFENEEFFEIGEDKTSRKLEKSEYIAFEDESKLFLDDIIFSPEYVVTGVRVKQNKNDISFEYRGTKFDFHTGRLLLDGNDASIWRSFEDMKKDNPSEDYKRDRTLLETKASSTFEVAPYNDVISMPNQWLEFTFAIVDRKFITVPMFDTRAVDTSPGFALSGVGLFHRGYEQIAGYVNFRLFNVDVPKYTLKTTYDSEEDYA